LDFRTGWISIRPFFIFRIHKESGYISSVDSY
jgi:hypothetical protein